MSKKLRILISVAIILICAVLFIQIRTGGIFNAQYINAHRALLFPILTVSALIDSINPCAISVLLITIAFLLSLGRMQRDIKRVGGSYIVGIFFVYMLIGLGILRALSFFGAPHFMSHVGAGILIIFGALELANYFFPSFPIKLRIPHAAHGTMARFMEKGSMPAALVLGALVGLYEFPCTGGVYLFVLGLLHDEATHVQGFFYLVWYNFIFVLPLIILLLIASDQLVFERAQEWRKRNIRKVGLWTGIVFIALAVLILVL